MKLFLVRHGQSEANLGECYAGQTDSRLTELGREQAAAIRPALADIPFDRVFSSDLSRAFDTQKLALPDYTAEQTPLLREYDVGSLTGMRFDEAIQKYGMAFRKKRTYVDFGGEDSAMVEARVRKFLAGLEENPCEYAAAFVHNGVIIAMMRITFGLEIDSTALFSNNCAIHAFEFDGTRWKLLAWNYMTRV